MTPGKFKFIFFLFLLNFSTFVFAEDKITTVPLVNLENLEPSFEKENSEDEILSEKKNISLKINSGAKIALVGMSGGGKSTLLNLIPKNLPIFDFFSGSWSFDIILFCLIVDRCIYR